MSTPLVRLMAHKGPVRAIAVDQGGRYLATAGADSQVKLWDIRTFQPIHSYWTHAPPSTLDISGTGLLGVGFTSHVEVWKDALATKQKAPYMTHHTHGDTVQSLKFCPFEDVLGIGHQNGFANIVIPGAGIANFDSLEANPYETKKQRREGEVHSLLDKLQPEMIALDPTFIGTVDRGPAEIIAEERRLAAEANAARKSKKVKNKTRGRMKMGKRMAKKQEAHDTEARQKKRKSSSGEAKGSKPAEPSVLDRFMSKE